jgi:FAD/FMN-containing dehydrogenase
MNNPLAAKIDAVEQLINAIGSAYVSIDEVTRKLLSTDLSFKPGEIAEVVVSPANSEEVATCVSIAASANMPIVARGGGM